MHTNLLSRVSSMTPKDDAQEPSIPRRAFHTSTHLEKRKMGSSPSKQASKHNEQVYSMLNGAGPHQTLLKYNKPSESLPQSPNPPFVPTHPRLTLGATSANLTLLVLSLPLSCSLAISGPSTLMSGEDLTAAAAARFLSVFSLVARFSLVTAVSVSMPNLKGERIAFRRSARCFWAWVSTGEVKFPFWLLSTTLTVRFLCWRCDWTETLSTAATGLRCWR